MREKTNVTEYAQMITESLSRGILLNTNGDKFNSMVIPCVTAWCANENIGSQRVIEQAGMQLIHTQKGVLKVGDKIYDKLMYEFKQENPIVAGI